MCKIFTLINYICSIPYNCKLSQHNMEQNEVLTATVAEWIVWYEGKRDACKRWLYVVLFADIIVLLIYPAMYLAHIHAGVIRSAVIIAFVFVIFLFATIKIRLNYLMFKELIISLENERELFITKAVPYAMADKKSSNLFLKNARNIISNSVSALTYMPEGFSDH